MIRLFHANGRLRFAGKDAELERFAAREIRERRRDFEELLFVENMALLGGAVGTESCAALPRLGDKRDREP